MHVINRDVLDPAAFQERLERAFIGQEGALRAARSGFMNLSGIAGYTMRIAALTSLGDLTSTAISAGFKLQAQALAGLFAVARRGAKAAVPLGDGSPVYFPSKPDESELHGGYWVDGFFASALCRDYASLASLCKTRSSFLRRSSSRDREFRYLFIDGLHAFYLGDPDASTLFLEAMKAADPRRPDLEGFQEWTLAIGIHQIRLMFLVVTQDEDFEAAMAEALEAHKGYYAKGDRRNDPAGMLPVVLLGIAALAYDRKIPFDIRSDYLPMHLVSGEAFK